MSKVSYPAVFHKENVGYWVEFPDLPGCFTQGDTLEESFRMAIDALVLYLDKNDELFDRIIPQPSPADTVISNYPDERVMLVPVDSLEYARQHKTKAVVNHITKTCIFTIFLDMFINPFIYPHRLHSSISTEIVDGNLIGRQLWSFQAPLIVSLKEVASQNNDMGIL